MTHDGFAKKIAALAAKAMLYEVSVTPKPGLVDRANSGAHRDMDYFTFLSSIAALIPYFEQVTALGAAHPGPPGTMLAALRPAGLEAEAMMLRATGGVNTHKGLIFSLGILCAAAGRLHARGRPLTEASLCRLCGQLAAETPAELARPGPGGPTHGQAAYAATGCTGARGEVAGGFPALRRRALPALRRHLAAGASFNDAGVAALLYLLADVDDSNLLARGGAQGLAGARARAEAVLCGQPPLGTLISAAQRLDDEFITNGLSPGGCADLLAIGFMFIFLV